MAELVRLPVLSAICPCARLISGWAIILNGDTLADGRVATAVRVVTVNGIAFTPAEFFEPSVTPARAGVLGSESSDIWICLHSPFPILSLRSVRWSAFKRDHEADGRCKVNWRLLSIGQSISLFSPSM
jgi:hypothetical protein